MAYQIDQNSSDILHRIRDIVLAPPRAPGQSSVSRAATPQIVGLVLPNDDGTWSFCRYDAGSDTWTPTVDRSDDLGQYVRGQSPPSMLLRAIAADGSPVNYLFQGNGGKWVAQITGSSLVSGQQAKWSYTLSEVDVNNVQSDGTFLLLDGGRTASDARNLWEAQNPSAGYGSMGSGHAITETDFDNGLKLLPVTTGTTVEVSDNYVDCLGNPMHIFSAPQGRIWC